MSDFLAVGFSVSSGCARRGSVSTYAAILVLLLKSLLIYLIDLQSTLYEVKDYKAINESKRARVK